METVIMGNKKLLILGIFLIFAGIIAPVMGLALPSPLEVAGQPYLSGSVYTNVAPHYQNRLDVRLISSDAEAKTLTVSFEGQITTLVTDSLGRVTWSFDSGEVGYHFLTVSGGGAPTITVGYWVVAPDTPTPTPTPTPGAMGSFLNWLTIAGVVVLVFSRVIR